jgi:hypothetical protein
VPQNVKPDASYVSKERKQLEDLWSNCHSKWAVIDSFYNRTFAVWPNRPDRPGWYRPMRARAIIDHAVDRQLAHEPTIHREPVGPSEDSRARADRVEPAIRAILHNIALEEISLPWKQAAKHMMLYGYTIVEDGLDSTVMQKRRTKPTKMRSEDKEDYEKRVKLWENLRKSMVPFRTRTPHPARVLMDPTRKRPSTSIKHTYRLASDLYDLTYARKEGKGRGRNVEVELFERDNPQELVLTDEYWSESWHGMFTSAGETLFIEPNVWGFQPTSHAFSGYGSEPTEMGNIDPTFMAVGLLDHAMEDLVAQAQEAASRHNAVLEVAWNPIVTEGDAAELAGQLASGDIIEARRGEVYRMEIQQVPRYLFESEAMIDRDLDMGTYSRSVSGTRETGVSTVGQQAILSTASDRKFVTPAVQLEHLASISTSHVLQLMDVLDMDLRVEGHTLRPSDLEGDYSVSVKFELIDPVLQMQNREMGLREVQAKLKSKETYWASDARLEDATGERKRLLSDLIREDPQVIALLAKQVAKEEGIDELLESIADNQGGGVGQPGQPQPLGGGQVPGNNQVSAGVNELNNGLTNAVFNPDRRGTNLAG